LCDSYQFHFQLLHDKEPARTGNGIETVGKWYHRDNQYGFLYEKVERFLHWNTDSNNKQSSNYIGQIMIDNMWTDCKLLFYGELT